MAIPKFVGRDCELSTTGIDPTGRSIASWDVASAVLGKIEQAFIPFGASVWSRATQSGINGSGFTGQPYSTDCLRHWVSNGQCYYADMGKVEVCTAPTLSPTQFGAQTISTLQAAEAARKLAQDEAAEGTRYSLSASNGDMLDPGVSWGSHINASVSKALWEDLFENRRHPDLLGFVASAMAAGAAFFGAGLLLPMKDGSMLYSLSGRAHHLSSIHTHATTERFRRGLLNTRREAHARDSDRLHLIGFDYAVASEPLLCSFLQCVLAAAEEGFCNMNLHDPVRALRTWSWQIDLHTGDLPATAALIDGTRVTLYQYMGKLASLLLEMCESGVITEEIAPEAPAMLARIVELTRLLEAGDLGACAPHLTWVAKLLFLMNLSAQEGRSFGDAQSRLADHDFTNTDPAEGVFWRLWELGEMAPLVEPSLVESCLRDGPLESRAWGRGRLIRRFRKQITDVNWDFMDIRRGPDYWTPRVKIKMPNPDSLNKAGLGPLIRKANSLDHLERLLGRLEEEPVLQEDPMENIVPQLATEPDTNKGWNSKGGNS